MIEAGSITTGHSRLGFSNSQVKRIFGALILQDLGTTVVNRQHLRDLLPRLSPTFLSLSSARSAITAAIAYYRINTSQTSTSPTMDPMLAHFYRHINETRIREALCYFHLAQELHALLALVKPKPNATSPVANRREHETRILDLQRILLDCEFRVNELDWCMKLLFEKLLEQRRRTLAEMGGRPVAVDEEGDEGGEAANVGSDCCEDRLDVSDWIKGYDVVGEVTLVIT